MTGDQTDDGSMEGVRRLRPTPVGKSKFKQSPEEIDRVLLEERKARASARIRPAHATPKPAKSKGGRPRTRPAPTLSQTLKAEMSIAAAKKRKRQAASPPAPHDTSKANMLSNLAQDAFRLAGVRTRKKRSDARITAPRSQKP